MDGEKRVMHKVTVDSVTVFLARLLEVFLLTGRGVWDGQDPSDATSRLLLLLARGCFAAIAKRCQKQIRSW